MNEFYVLVIGAGVWSALMFMIGRVFFPRPQDRPIRDWFRRK